MSTSLFYDVIGLISDSVAPVAMPRPAQPPAAGWQVQPGPYGAYPAPAQAAFAQGAAQPVWSPPPPPRVFRSDVPAVLPPPPPRGHAPAPSLRHDQPLPQFDLV